MSPLRRAAAGVAAAAGACVAYGTLVERRWYRVRRLRLPGSLTAAADGPIRILHIADVHLAPPQPDRVRFLRSLTDEDYDLVVASGDLLGDVGAEDATAAALAPLVEDRPGVVTLGSNDLFGPTPRSPHHYFVDREVRHYGRRLDTERFVTALRDSGYAVLRDEVTTVEVPTGSIAVAGLDDPHLDRPLPPVDAVHSRNGPADAALRLGIVHAPYTAALDLLVAADYDVLLAGHTHGGQVRFPPIGALVGNCDLPLDRVRGASRWQGRWLHVTPGVGQSRYAPFRFACRPEATVLELTA